MWLSLLADVNQKSVEFLRHAWKANARLDSPVERLAGRKELRSLQELRIRIRDMFYFDEGLILTTFQIIFQNTVNTVLAR